MRHVYFSPQVLIVESSLSPTLFTIRWWRIVPSWVREWKLLENEKSTKTCRKDQENELLKRSGKDDSLGLTSSLLEVCFSTLIPTFYVNFLPFALFLLILLCCLNRNDLIWILYFSFSFFFSFHFFLFSRLGSESCMRCIRMPKRRNPKTGLLGGNVFQSYCPYFSIKILLSLSLFPRFFRSILLSLSLSFLVSSYRSFLLFSLSLSLFVSCSCSQVPFHSHG